MICDVIYLLLILNENWRFPAVVKVYCILKLFFVTKIETVMLTLKKFLKRQFKRGPAF